FGSRAQNGQTSSQWIRFDFDVRGTFGAGAARDMRVKRARTAKRTAPKKAPAAKAAPKASHPDGRRKSTKSAADLGWQRETFVHTFFKKGAEFTEDLLGENDRLRKQNRELETDNAALRTQLASDEAIRDLLKKIDRLEREKGALLSHIGEAEAVSTRVTTRYSEMEEELST